MRNKISKILGIISVFIFIGCSDFLDEKSDTRLSTPETLADNQALLDHYNLINSANTSSNIAADDIYINDNDYKGLSSEAEKRLYTWQSDRVATNTGNDWENCYVKINICNTVLNNIETYHIADAGNVRGQALALRASLYLEAAQLWCLAYNNTTANSEMGLPLRLDPDMNVPSVRSTLQQTYDQILKDLNEAINLLPVKQVAVSRFSKTSALALLARAYLYMGNYEKALASAKQAMSYYDVLQDFNTLNSADSYPFKALNAEVLFPLYTTYSPLLGSNLAKIPQDLYNDFNNNDLRKLLYFRINTSGDIFFKGNYSGNSGRTMVLGTDELYLVAAECYARLNDLTSSMKMLNDLLITRWKTGTFMTYNADTKEKALQIIARERRKELLFRGMRWADIKRYNRDGANITLTRIIEGQVFTLQPNDLRYAIAIPEDIIKMTGMPQNKR